MVAMKKKIGSSLKYAVGVLAIVAFVHVVLIFLFDDPNPFKENENTARKASSTNEATINYQDDDDVLSSTPAPHLLYKCPGASHIRSKNSNDETSMKFNFAEEIKMYQKLDQEILNNVTDFAEHFLEKKIDGYHQNYRARRRNLIDWKRFAFQNISNGDLIYESATGIGLNIFITAEMLTEELNITNVTFYGNDFVQESVDLFRTLYNQNVFPSSMNLGSVCTSDSRTLTYVPSNSFDYVYSGYITPLQDPLQYGTDDWADRLYDDTCKKNFTKKLNLLAQERQEEWFRQWLSEMIRIAKPGATIMIEDNAEPYCVMLDDWGGVSSSSSFWHSLDGIDYDNEPIYIEHQQTEWHGKSLKKMKPPPTRYNVLMKKKKSNGANTK